MLMQNHYESIINFLPSKSLRFYDTLYRVAKVKLDSDFSLENNCAIDFAPNIFSQMNYFEVKCDHWSANNVTVMFTVIRNMRQCTRFGARYFEWMHWQYSAASCLSVGYNPTQIASLFTYKDMRLCIWLEVNPPRSLIISVVLMRGHAVHMTPTNEEAPRDAIDWKKPSARARPTQGLWRKRHANCD